MEKSSQGRCLRMMTEVSLKKPIPARQVFKNSVQILVMCDMTSGGNDKLELGLGIGLSSYWESASKHVVEK